MTDVSIEIMLGNHNNFSIVGNGYLVKAIVVNTGNLIKFVLTSLGNIPKLAKVRATKVSIEVN